MVLLLLIKLLISTSSFTFLLFYYLNLTSNTVKKSDEEWVAFGGKNRERDSWMTALSIWLFS